MVGHTNTFDGSSWYLKNQYLKKDKSYNIHVCVASHLYNLCGMSIRSKQDSQPKPKGHFYMVTSLCFKC